MKKYIAIYKRLMISNWRTLLEYRGDFIARIFASLMFASYHIITVMILTQAVPVVYGWTRNELLLLATTYSVFISIYHMFISHNLSRLADEIYFGRLDFLLLKPIDSQLSTVLWHVEFMNLIRFLVSVVITIYLLNVMAISLTVNIVIQYIFTIFVGIFLLYFLWLPFISLLIFNPRLSNIVTLLYNSSTIARFPQEMYRKLPLYIFVPLIPLTLVMTSPTKVLLQKMTFDITLQLILICLLLGIVSRLFWKFSLRHYTGAST